MKFVTTAILAIALAACSADDRSSGNGPGDADGAGRGNDSQTTGEDLASKAVPYDPGIATRERPSADAHDAPETPSDTQPRTAEKDAGQNSSEINSAK